MENTPLISLSVPLAAFAPQHIQSVAAPAHPMDRPKGTLDDQVPIKDQQAVEQEACTETLATHVVHSLSTEINSKKPMSCCLFPSHAVPTCH